MPKNQDEQQSSSRASTNTRDSNAKVATGIDGPYNASAKIEKGYDAIVVFVDQLTKMAHFSPATTSVNAPEIARLFFDTVFKLHELPQVMKRSSRHQQHITRKPMVKLKEPTAP
ncbi:uncharacterized protein VTP21DRAFT_1033 [Calcarisporiella thermophila]|uniref:uncharacterized protein n=1 Tax=Calcarisporiella thermophila TaxID=911321 RepID=UPI0037440A77